MKTIAITGATGGIGQSIAKTLFAEGYNLILLSRCEKKLHNSQKSLLNCEKGHEKGYKKDDEEERILSYPIDYDDLDSPQKFEQWLVSTGKKLDGFVMMTLRPAMKNELFPSPKEWQNFFQSHFIGPLEFLKIAINHMQDGAKIVIISGISSVQIMPDCCTFGVLRSMWLSQAKALAYDYGPKGITVNTVSPGGVLTKDAIKRMDLKAQEKNISFDEQYAKSTSNVPLRKYAHPQEVASVVSFFLSSQSNHITGTNLMCDGGFTRSY